MQHVHRAHFDAVAARVLHQLRRGVKAHRLTIEHGGQVAGALVALEPATDVNQQRKTGGVTLRKAVFAKTFDLLEDGVGELLRVAARQHATDHAFVEFVHTTLAFPGRHRAAQAV